MDHREVKTDIQEGGRYPSVRLSFDFALFPVSWDYDQKKKALPASHCLLRQLSASVESSATR